jgi:methenyltetrahydrofolate cyclohydrolase
MTDVKHQTLGQYLEALRSTAAVPGGGSAAAVSAALGAALVSMVAKLSARKAASEADRDALNRIHPELDELGDRLLDLSQQDIGAYRAVIDGRKAGLRGAELERAYEHAAEVPLAVANAAARALALAADASKRAWEMTASDLAVGNELLEAGFHGALGNVVVNLPELRGEAAARIERAYQQLRAATPG